jgi:hypothetical protein
MPIYEITSEWIEKIPKATFSEVGIRERSDLQRPLRDQIGIISPATLVIAEVFGEWGDSPSLSDWIAPVCTCTKLCHR